MTVGDIEIEIIPKSTHANKTIMKTHSMDADSPFSQPPIDNLQRNDQNDEEFQKPQFYKLPKNVGTQFIDVISGFVLSRVIFVILAQGAWMNINTVANYCSIFFPLQISVYHLNFAYQPFQWRALRITFGVLKVILLFGFGWTAPSSFSTSNDTLSNLCAFLCLSRSYFAVTSIIDAYNYRTILNPAFVNACLTFPALITWITCFFTDTTPQFYSLFVIGVFVDISSLICCDLFKSRRLGLTVKFDRPIFNLIGVTEAMTLALQIFFGCCVWYLFETRRLVEYPDAMTAVQFIPVNFFYGSMAVLILFNLFCLYNYSLKFWMLDSERQFQNRPTEIFLYSTLLKWVHFIMTGSFGLLTASLSLLLFDLYTSPSILVNQFPVNLSTFPDSVQFNKNLEISYFKQAAEQGGITVEGRSTFYLPVVFGAYGFYLLCQSLAEVVASKLSHVDVRYKTLTTLIPGVVIVGLAFLPESLWQSSGAKITVLCTTFGISTFILFVSQFFVMQT